MPEGSRFRRPGKRDPWSREPGTAYLGPTEVDPPEIGDGSARAKATGFIANGWDGHGSRVADPADRRRTWFGRATARGGGWVLDMDALDPGGDLPGKLRREGGTVSPMPSASTAPTPPRLPPTTRRRHSAVRSALSLILGRRADVVPAGRLEPRPAALGAVDRRTGRYLPRTRNLAARQHRR
jgi:hypothetical protein